MVNVVDLQKFSSAAFPTTVVYIHVYMYLCTYGLNTVYRDRALRRAFGASTQLTLGVNVGHNPISSRLVTTLIDFGAVTDQPSSFCGPGPDHCALFQHPSSSSLMFDVNVNVTVTVKGEG